MCNAEFMVFSSLYQKYQEEQIKEIERDAVKSAAARGLGAEELRRTQEEQSVDIWFDQENRKIAVAAGATATEMAGAGVDIPVLLDQWKDATVELLGSRLAHLRNLAMTGDIRANEIVESKAARLKVLAPAGPMEWAIAFGTGLAQGIAMEKAMGTWEGDVFGIKLPQIPGTPEKVPMPGDDSVTPVKPIPTIQTGSTPDVLASSRGIPSFIDSTFGDYLNQPRGGPLDIFLA